MPSITRKRSKAILYLISLFVVASGCAKYKEYESVFPPSNNVFAKYQKVVVQQSTNKQRYHDFFENALKTALTSIHPGNFQPAKNLKQISSDIYLFDYNPKLNSIPDEKIAYISFDLNVKEDIRRDRNSRYVSLRRCNYLNKQVPCFTSGSARLSTGNQVLNVVITGKLYLKNHLGNHIIPIIPIQKTVVESGIKIRSSTPLINSGLNEIAYNFSKLIIPHKEKVNSEIMRGGDSIAMKMILHGAFNSAVNRLEKLVSQSNEAEVDDYYNLGIAYEALNEFPKALENVLKAKDMDPDEENIRMALSRLRRIIPL